MPIRKTWTKFTPSTLRRVPSRPGAYELADKNRHQIYVGKSENLNRRLREHHKSRANAIYFRYEVTPIFKYAKDLEAEHSIKYRKKHGKKPRDTKRSPPLFSWLRSI